MILYRGEALTRRGGTVPPDAVPGQRAVILTLASLLLAACGEDAPTRPDPGPPGELALEVVAEGLSQPVHLTAPPGGNLWVGLGDGGSAGDPRGNGQDPGTLLGSLLRLDVDGGDPYALLPGNPFVGSDAGRGEVWAYGLRNPWRYDIDGESGRLYVADVGQSDWEEVNVRLLEEAGLNYGWNVMEGRHCFRSDSCDRTGLTLPVLEYPQAEGCSVTGGHVYRGEARDRREWDVPDLGGVTSFGVDADGELYVLTAAGSIHRLVPG